MYSKFNTCMSLEKKFRTGIEVFTIQSGDLERSEKLKLVECGMALERKVS